jgi:dTDP-4-dehydrorhamnose reductase
MKVLITGAKGQLASDLISLLKESGSEVIPYGKDTFDVSVLNRAIKIGKEIKPDVIINCAAYTDVDGCETNIDLAYKVNSLGAKNVAISARKIESKLIHISTDYVFDGKKGFIKDRVPLAYTEWDLPNPKAVYGHSKWTGEIFVREQCPNHFVIRTGWLYGAAGQNFVKAVLSKSEGLKKDGKPLCIVDDQFGTPTWTKDLAEQILKIMATESFGTYHATSQGFCTWYEFAKEIRKKAGVKVEIQPCTSENYPTPARRPRNSVLDNWMLRLQDLDFMPDWKESFHVFWNQHGGYL